MSTVTKKEPLRQTDPDVLGVLHRADGAWRAVVANCAGPVPAVIDTREFSDDDLAMDAWLEQHMASEVLIVLPASSVICRTCPLPDADPAQLEQALVLQAEAHQLDNVPLHRSAMAVLESASGESTRTGLILAWPDSSPVERPRINLPTRFVPDVGAVAALLNGDRPADPIVWVERETGSIAIGLSHANGAAFRGTRENLQSVEDWQKTVGQVLAETGLNSNHTPEFVRTIVERTTDALHGVAREGSRLLIPSELTDRLADRVRGVSGDESFWESYGIAIGALLARTGPLQPLTTLEHDTPLQRQTILHSLVTRLSDPASATKIIIACLLVLALSPAIFSFARLQVLQLRHQDIDERQRRITEVRKIDALYQELDRERWTMTKLLADLACNTPVGIELDSIRVSRGEGLSVTGKAFPDGENDRSAQEVVSLMQAQMQDWNVFSGISVDWDEATNFGSYKFSLTAKVARPHGRPNYPEELDFAAYPYDERLYPELRERRRGQDDGDGESTAIAGHTDDSATDDAAPAATDEMMASAETVEDTNTTDDRNGRRGPRRFTGTGGTSDFGGDTDRSIGGGDKLSDGARPGGEIPPPLTQEQIATMSKEEAQDRLVAVSRARNWLRKAPPSDDPNDETEKTKVRLQQEWQWLLDRAKE